MATATKKTPATSKSATPAATKKTSVKKEAGETKNAAKTTTGTTKKAVAKTPAVKKAPSATIAATAEKPTRAPAVKKAAAKKTGVPVSPEQRYHMISTAAYYLAEKRGFAGGYEMQDWISAEAEIDARLKA